jgi:hypothetical protein
MRSLGRTTDKRTNSIPTQGVTNPSLRSLSKTEAVLLLASRNAERSLFHASFIHHTKVITHLRDPRLKAHPVLFSENSLPSIRSHNKPNMSSKMNNGLCDTACHGSTRRERSRGYRTSHRTREACMNKTIFPVTAKSNIAETDRRFTGAYCSKYPRNVTQFLPDYTAQ